MEAKNDLTAKSDKEESDPLKRAEQRARVRAALKEKIQNLQYANMLLELEELQRKKESGK